MHTPRRAEGGIAAANVGVRPGNRYPRKPKQDDSPGVLRKIASGIAAPFEQMFDISQGDYAPLGVEWVDGEGWVQSPERAIPFAADLAGMATTGALGAPPVAGAAGMGIRAYHASPYDFEQFAPSEFRGATFLAGSPNRARTGAAAGRNEMVMDTATELPPVQWRMYEADIDPSKIEGLSLRPRELEWFKNLPEEIVGDDAFDKVWNTRPAEISNWDLYYDAEKIGDRLYRYTKKTEPPTVSYEEAYTTGRDVYGQQWPHYSQQGSEKNSAARVLDDGMGGWLVQDEAGLSIALADPSIARIVNKDILSINILKKYGLAGLTAAGGAGAAMLGGSDPASASQPEYTTGGKFAAGGRTPRMATGGIADATQMRVTVQKGDNPSKIAKRILGAGASGTEVQALANAIVAANGIKNDRRIQIGESLIIPGQSAPEVDMPTPRTRASGIAAQANASYRPEVDKPTGLSANPRRDAMAKGLAGIGAPAKNDAGWAPYFQMTRAMNQREAIRNEVDQRMRDANLMDNPAPGMKGRPFTTPYSGMPAIDTMRVSPSMSVRVKENMDIGTTPNADIPKSYSQVAGLPDMNAGKFPPDYVPGLLPLQNVPTKGTSPAQLSLGAMSGSIENTASRFAEPPKRSLPDGATTGEHFTDDRPLFMPGVSSSLGHGLIKSAVPGRTDQLPLTVPKDSYIVPADVISGLGQGNTDAGWPLLKRILAARGADIDEGAPVNDGGVEIIAAGGEGVIHPEVISALGGGDVRRGHRLLDDIVLSVRKQTAKRLSSLPGPKK